MMNHMLTLPTTRQTIRSFASAARRSSGMGLTPVEVQLGAGRWNDQSSMIAEEDSLQDFLLHQREEVAPNERMKGQLTTSEGQLRHRPQHTDVKTEKANASPLSSKNSSDSPLPRLLSDALRPSKRAIVITEASAPFRVVDVNDAWVQLCEYSFVESRGKTLGSLIQGPETDIGASTALISQCLKGEQAGMTLVNYTKSGRKFHNRIRVGPLQNDSGETTHFIGILQEVNEARM